MRTVTAIVAFGKSEQVKKVFWTFFVAMTRQVLARVIDPVTIQQVVGIITGIGPSAESRRPWGTPLSPTFWPDYLPEAEEQNSRLNLPPTGIKFSVFFR
jgi:hypothetical protein